MKKKKLLLAMIAIARLSILPAQILIPNAGFEQIDKSLPSKTANWKAESDNFTCITDKNQFFKGANSLMLKSSNEGHHFFNEEFPFSSPHLKKYRLKCAVKTQGLSGKIFLGARVFDNKGNTLSKMMFTVTEKRDQEWTISEGVFVSEDGAAKIRVFGSLFGTGEVWFDEFSIEELPDTERNPSTETAIYVHEYFDVVYQNSIISDRFAIANIKAATMWLCGDGTDLDQCRYILQQYTTPKLNDGHSFFTTASEWKAMMEQGKHPATGKTLQDMPTGKMIDNRIALLHVPMFVSSDEKLIAEYADSLQSMIAFFDGLNPKGWIVDLSNNGGGNCFPMIAGIGPLIGNGICEMSYSGDGSVRKIIYSDGWTGTLHDGGDSTLFVMKKNPYRLKDATKPIAVIYGENTASSGEVTAIAFRGLANTRSFGRSTHGVTTRIDNFELSDGSYLNLAAGVNADRNQNRFTGKIEPDVKTQNTETAIAEAVKWILKK